MTKKETGFKEAVSKIEEILKNIEEGEPDIDRLSTDVKKAAELISICRARLRETEDQINEIMKDLR